jgi:nucleoside-diphosphate-sugar epimerase
MKKILVIGGAGYIGSSLVRHLREQQFDVTSMDLGWFGNVRTEDLNVDFAQAGKSFYTMFSHVVLLAAHSSMAMCQDNYESAWANNVTNFSSLLSKLDKDQVLIYASSGSVYGQGGKNRLESMSLASAQIEYDLTKQIIEQLAVGAQCKTVGLRFGTLGGFNNVARSDLMLNAMTISAKNNGYIQCFNGTNHRSILGINDCVRAIATIIEQDQLVEKTDIFNLASFSGSIESFATGSAKLLDVIVMVEDKITNKFSFELNCDRFINRFNFTFNDTTESIITGLLENYDKITWSPRVDKIQYV